MADVQAIDASAKRPNLSVGASVANSAPELRLTWSVSGLIVGTMLIGRPADDELYEALIARDDAYEGQAWVAVTTTGIFCRLTCPARKPRRHNVRFFDSIAACIEAGFRPCKRCQPLRAAGVADPTVSGLVERVLADPERRWSEADLIADGLEPSTVRRAFKRQLGTTFVAFARSVRLTRGGVELAGGHRVIDAQVTAGFESASGFRDAFAKKLGVAPGRLVEQALVRADWIPTPIGPMLAVASAAGLALLEFFDRRALPTELTRLRRDAAGSIGIGRFPVHDRVQRALSAYFAGRSQHFDVPLALGGTPFQRAVWAVLRTIPAGRTMSYRQVAEAIAKPTATRAVARANGANTLAVVIPCHRVIGADGALTGYGGGVWRKQWLVDHERQHFLQQDGQRMSNSTHRRSNAST